MRSDGYWVKTMDPLRRQVEVQAVEKIQIQAAGLNHFTWMISVYDRRSGENLYPLFKQRWAELEPSFEPLTRRVYDTFGLFPIPGDEHLCEYLPSEPLRLGCLGGATRRGSSGNVCDGIWRIERCQPIGNK